MTIKITPTQLTRNWQKAHPEKYLKQRTNWYLKHYQGWDKHKVYKECHYLTCLAIKCGTLTRPTACTKCGATGIPIEGHHASYSKPLKIRWLCRQCHIPIDARRRKRLGIVRKYTTPTQLTQADHDLVRKLFSEGMSQVKIGKLLKISNCTCSKIVNFKTRPRAPLKAKKASKWIG